ncbi:MULTISPECIES: hypothetical protein [unclassified Psychrobacter]|uniref:hypothetical protein n=1 Tax=unclassified Psychrobacter TaxID=196806 RepID=UPI003FD62404
MSEDIINNNPKKEFMFALVGVGMFLAIVLLIGISAFLRPAGEHITAEATEESVAAENAEAIVAEDTAEPAATDGAEDTDLGAGESAALEDQTIGAATVTPDPSTGDSIVATQAAEATADGVVNQEAVAETDLVGPSDQVAGTVNPPVAAQ